MNTVLFVHGTGARDPHFSQALGRIREGLKGRAVVEPCYWGGTEGSKLNAGGASIPLYDSTRSFRDSWSAEGLTREKDYEFALWELLLKDPLVELRLLATAFDPTDELSPTRMKECQGRHALKPLTDFYIRNSRKCKDTYHVPCGRACYVEASCQRELADIPRDQKEYLLGSCCLL
jgi:hypothetical protein